MNDKTTRLMALRAELNQEIARGAKTQDEAERELLAAMRVEQGLTQEEAEAEVAEAVAYSEPAVQEIGHALWFMTDEVRFE